MIKKLIDQNQICFFVEHWLEENEAYLFNDICNNHSIIFKSDFDRMVNSRGRPFGGKCWVIDNKFKVKSFEELSNEISLITLELDKEIIIHIFGVWFPFDDNSMERLTILKLNL